MLRAAISFFILAIVAYLFGFNGIMGISLEIGRLLLVVFVGLAIISYIASVISKNKIESNERNKIRSPQ